MARFRTWVGIAVAGALTLSLAGCSSTGGKRAEDARKAAAARG
ncbi:MAG TPA: sugar ABC transporter substrate-binding protein, partial [Streptomyces sp.]|nr:sugar ABC transporter substrate-binding protein [Streptomyces sp.]